MLMDPVTLFYGMVRLVVMDSVAFGPDTDYSRVEYTAYRGGLCECPLFTATCACFGDVMASGQVGPDSDPCGAAGCQDTEWTQAVAGAVYLPRERSLYSLHVRLAGYVDRVVGADAWMDGEARVVMVPVPRPGELRIVLTWAQVPLEYGSVGQGIIKLTAYCKAPLKKVLKRKSDDDVISNGPEPLSP